MATISGNGGAERYWRHPDGRRAVLCRNGVMLVQPRSGGRWQTTAFLAGGPAHLIDWADPPGWQEDTGQAARAAVTRTGRQARRREGG